MCGTNEKTGMPIISNTFRHKLWGHTAPTFHQMPCEPQVLFSAFQPNMFVINYYYESEQLLAALKSEP